MKIGNKIQLLRTQKKWSQAQLAEAIGVSRQAVSKWELNEALPDAQKILALAQLFHVSTDYLLDNEMHSYVPSKRKSTFPIKKLILCGVLLLIIISSAFMVIKMQNQRLGNQHDYFEKLSLNENNAQRFSCSYLENLYNYEDCSHLLIYEIQSDLIIQIVLKSGDIESLQLSLPDLQVENASLHHLKWNNNYDSAIFEDLLINYFQQNRSNSFDSIGFLSDYNIESAAVYWINPTFACVQFDQYYYFVSVDNNQIVQQVLTPWQEESHQEITQLIISITLQIEEPKGYVRLPDGKIILVNPSFTSEDLLISPFLCPPSASYQIDYLDDRSAQITFTGTNTAEIVAAMPGVVRSVQDLGEDGGVSMTISYLDGSIAHYQHLSHNFWLSSNVEIFYSGQLIGYAKSDTEDSASFQYTLELPDNRVIAQDELFANQLFCSRKINVFPLSDSMELFSMDKLTEINQLAIQSEAFKLYAPSKTPRSEAVGIVSEIFGNKMHSFSVSTSSHDIHTIYLEQTETGFIANRCYEIDSTLQGIAQTAYSAVLDLGISIGIYDEEKYQSLILSIRINNGQFYFYGEYDPQTHQLVPLDSMDVILFPSDEVEAIIMQEIKEMYSTILKVDKAMLDFSKEAISLLTERSHDLIYPPLPEFSTNT